MRSYYVGFRTEKFEAEIVSDNSSEGIATNAIELHDSAVSIFDEMCGGCLAQ